SRGNPVPQRVMDKLDTRHFGVLRLDFGHFPRSFRHCCSCEQQTDDRTSPMRDPQKHRQVNRGIARTEYSKRPLALIAMNQNEPEEDHWLSVCEAAGMAARRWWMDE